MAGENLYYCWNCDAHRDSEIRNVRPCCSHCGAELSEESRLPVIRRVGLAGMMSRLARPTTSISRPPRTAVA